MGSLIYTIIIMVIRTEVIKGVFDPRNFKNDDPNWAKKRKSEYLAFPGVIKYTRERTYDDHEEKKQEVEEEKCKEIKINIIKDNPSAKKTSSNQRMFGQKERELILLSF